MADFSALSNDDLLKMYQASEPAPLAGLSNEQLMALHQQTSQPPAQGMQYDQYGAPTAESLAQVQGGTNVTSKDLIDKLAGIAGSFSHGQSLGVGDELNAAAKATLAPITRPIARALGGGAPDPGDTWRQRYEKVLTTDREAAKKFAQENPVTNAIANIGGNVLSTTAMLPEATVSAPSFVGRMVKGAATGAGLGGMLGFTEGEGGLDQRLAGAKQGAKTGAIVGAAVPPVASMVGRAITPLPADATRRAAVQTLEQAGVPVSAGNRTGNVTLRTAEDYISKLPLGSAISRNPSAESMPALTQAIATRAGLPAGEVPTADVLQRGFDRVGGRIGTIQRTYPVQVDQPMLNEVVNIAADIPLLSSTRQNAALHFVDRLTSAQTLSPEMAQATRTQLNRAIRGQNGPNGDKEYQALLIDLKGTLDDALTRSIQATGNTAHVAQLQQLRQQYANLHTLSDALYSSGSRGQLGELTAGALQTAQARSFGKGSYMKGRGDLTPLASASKAVLPQVAESGTPLREGILNPFKWALSLPAQLAVNSRPAQAYWGNQLLPPGAADTLTQPIIAGTVAEQQRRRGLLSP